MPAPPSSSRPLSKSLPAPRPARRVLVLAFPGAQLLDVAGPSQVFATATELAAPRAGYALQLVSPAGGRVATSSGVAVDTVAPGAVAPGPLDTLLVVGGPGVHAAAADPALRRRVLAWSRRARRTVSVCTGAFLLAACGLLEGRRAVTHWAWCDRLQDRHPGIRVERDPIFVRDGRIWSSAGVTAGIDLALALVEADLGHEVAMRAARHLVVFLKRPGGQAQFSQPLRGQAAGDPDLAALQAWMADNLAADLRVEALAARAGMSPRSFARVFAARTGTTPAKAVEALRVEAARRALESSDAPVKQVAHACGFGDEERLRRAFLRRLGVPPSDYRARFARAA